jgi:hypothetical protein
MATLWWSWNQYNLSPAAGDIGAVMSSIASGLPSLGYTGIEQGADVHGLKGDFLLAVTYLPISGSNFWQVVVAGGDGAVADAQAEVTEVINMINNFAWL